MAILPIDIYGNEVLKKKTKNLNDIDDSTVKLIMDMFETLKNASGLGLAANQVGISSAMAVLDLSAVSKDDEDDFYSVPDEFKKQLILINPEIIKTWDEYTLEEGCLSIPEIRAEVTRPKVVKVKYRDGKFEEKVQDFDGLLARVMQHEIDHLNGKLFVEKIGKVKSALMRKRLKKIQEGNFKSKYPVHIK